MEATELDILLEELETRVERLRSLYEQYFLGIEKIPPHVAQKDVDRRVYLLRREQIRNTARRFKLQTIIQRYNTFQQYWMRIMREIENGTYRRHVLRAERTVGVTDLLTAAERKRLALPERGPRSTNPPTNDSTEANPTEQIPPAAADPVPIAPLEAKAPFNATQPMDSTQSARAVRAQIERELGLLLDDDLDGLNTKGLADLGSDLDDPLLSSMPPPLRRKPSAKPTARRSARPNIERQRVQKPIPSQTNSAQSPTNSSTKPTSRQLARSTPTSASQSAASQAPRRTFRPSRGMQDSANLAGHGGLRLPATSAVAGRGLPPLPRTAVARGAPQKIPSSPIIAVEGKPQSSSVNAAERGKQSSASAAIRPKVPPNPPLTTKPQPSARPLASPPTKPQPTTRPKPTPPGLSLTNGSSAESPGSLDRSRVERIAEKLRDARKQTNEMSPVSVDALAKKLQTTAEQLREKHKGKQVDFDVIIKDGKAIVKPIVR